ncbi:hypothetical protein SELMODRAFT_113427 [Selaginella moellendorffii]|uniref:Signal peptidase complex subunit 1 n=1 Tax=Selaginella moellendorffii TaxID=88036 RepID=D8SC59_SELML|nr:hypothetical protein SELMODRAFT_113427 [Selaginella moellendorffii]
MNPSLAEQILQYALVAAAVLAMASGLLTASLKTMVLVYGGSVFVVLLVLIPDWAFFCRHPRHWVLPTPNSPDPSQDSHKIRRD